MKECTKDHLKDIGFRALFFAGVSSLLAIPLTPIIGVLQEYNLTKKVIRVADTNKDGILSNLEIQKMLGEMDYNIRLLKLRNYVPIVRDYIYMGEDRVRIRQRENCIEVHIPSLFAKGYLQSHKQFHHRPRNTI